MSLLILPPSRTSLRRAATAWAEELHFDARTVGRAVAAFDRDAARAHTKAMSVRSDLPGFKVGDARRALAGLPSPGDYRLAIKALRYRTRPSLSGLCDHDLRRSIL